MTTPGVLAAASNAASSDGKWHLRYPGGNAPLGAALASTALASAAATGALTTGGGGGGGGTIYLQEDYNTYPSGNITSITSALSTMGYSAVIFQTAGDIQILGRSSMPAALLSNPSFPSGKTQICLFSLDALEDESRLTWTGFPNSTTRVVSWSWWEYHDNANGGLQKFMRAGNYLNGVIGANRGIDAIIGLDAAGVTTLFSNSANMHGFPDQPFGTLTGWPPGLNFFERVDNLPTDTSSTYSSEFYVNDVLQGSTSGIQIYDTTAQAAVGWQLWDFGGWASGSGTFPIKRYMCAARIASQRQGVWPMSAI